jgi:AmiR/NasT family two-component response regulator
VALVQDKAATDRDLLNEQLQTALASRVVLEQAKGVLAQIGGLDMDQAFATLRGYARDHNRRLTEVARAVVSRQLPAQHLIDHAAARPDRPSGSSSR